MRLLLSPAPAAAGATGETAYFGVSQRCTTDAAHAAVEPGRYKHLAHVRGTREGRILLNTLPLEFALRLNMRDESFAAVAFAVFCRTNSSKTAACRGKRLKSRKGDVCELRRAAAP